MKRLKQMRKEKLERKLAELSDIVVNMETLPVDDPAHEHRVRLKKVVNYRPTNREASCFTG